jgi:hypothetical protein
LFFQSPDHQKQAPLQAQAELSLQIAAHAAGIASTSKVFQNYRYHETGASCRLALPFWNRLLPIPWGRPAAKKRQR